MINADNPSAWKADIAQSVQMYNDWFLGAAPKTYRDARIASTARVEAAFVATDDLRTITPDAILAEPSILAVLRMSTAPPLARDRLTGLSGTSKSLLYSLEVGVIPPRMIRSVRNDNLRAMCDVLIALIDLDLFPWLSTGGSTEERDRDLATMVVTDRLTGAAADPIIRNAQEVRQLALIEQWLEIRQYRRKSHPATKPLNEMEPGTYSFRMNVVAANESGRSVNIPIDAVIQPHSAISGAIPLLIEAKSAGDFTNTNKRRKEEATKVRQLRAMLGEETSLLLFLCGYFDAGYLGYEAAEGLDWVWEHRIEDLERAGV